MPVALQSPAGLPATVTAQQNQLQPQTSPLILEMSQNCSPSQVDQTQHEGHVLPEANIADSQRGQQDDEPDHSLRHYIRLFDRRLQAVEASSRRMERNMDQILEYCRTIAQAMNTG